ncbi:replicative DNA helicase [Gammaproteobacteria bacterium]|nr:replicative DNA helicase [Gammaproteobacteria bacterium]MDA7818568.1 replicative DNA helicase [Gammaproteobacteria bacterium]MDA7856451.1 replicative DNA helicase [Gammaproteobacteria bacterium]MDA9044643.1 replicative DNA helicase [Gammaproteobacteria bacterium]MDA9117459.1 replicative DNA helicase [Gammaproteobacteria bacterium]|tara:strand:+ start:1782 stop:3149 length:1368 start_codon:yes stop_codon:yes gene_type:complete
MTEIPIDQNNQAREAERAVLGGLMLETHRFDTVIQVITEVDFQGKDHQIIFESMAELVNENKPLDPLTVSEKLDNSNNLNRVGGKNYLIELATSTPSAANLEAYAEIIRQRSISRKLMQANSEITEIINNPQGQNGEELLDHAERLIFALNDETSQNDSSLQSMKELIPSTMDRLHELSNKKGGLIGSSTGFKDLDKKLQGIQDGDLIIVAGRPSMGKTSFAMNIAENVLVNDDADGAVLIFSLEMPGESLTTRMLSGMCKLDQQNVRSGMLRDDQLKVLMQEGERLKNLPLWIDDSSLLSPMELRAKARRLARSEGGLSLIVVDYLQLMQLPTSAENRVNQISEISRSLKSLAKELNVPVVALSQLNRAVEQRPNKRPIMADLRDSGAIEQDADVILFIYRDEVYNEDSEQGNKAEIIIGKQRNGPIGTIHLTFLKEYTRFENFSNDGFYDSFE